jgi:VIT1/CCC1 family predicted Fe2+/Mn2+ transporter
MNCFVTWRGEAMNNSESPRAVRADVVDSLVNMTSSSAHAQQRLTIEPAVGKSRELMKTSNVLRRVYGVTAALTGVLFFFIIVGVFGLPLAIAGLAIFVFGAVVVCRAFRSLLSPRALRLLGW